jgi:hypothetical protein
MCRWGAAELLRRIDVGKKKRKVKKKCCEKYLKSGRHCKNCPELISCEVSGKKKAKGSGKKTEKKKKKKNKKGKKEKR